MLKPIGTGSTTQITQTEATTRNTESPAANSQNVETSQQSAQASKTYAYSRLADQTVFSNIMAQQLNSQAASTPPTTVSDHDFVARGSSGPQVTQVQKDLNEWRVLNGMKPIAEDGVFGSRTEAAIREFQRMNGLKEDGVAGSNTRIRMQMENSPQFKALDPGSQNKLRECSIRWQEDPVKQQHLNSFIQDGADLSQLSQSHRDQVVDSFVQNPEGWMKMGGVYGNDIFRKMDDSLKTRVLDMGAKNIQNDAYMKDLNDLMATPQMYYASDAEKKKILDDFEISHSPMVTHEEWKSLDAGTQKKLGELYLQWKDDPAKADHLWQFVADGALSELSQENRDQVVQAFEKNPGGWMDMVGVYGNDNFRKMDQELKTQTLGMASAHSQDPVYMKDLNQLFMSAEFYAMTNAEKAQALQDFDAAHTPIV